MLAFGAISKYMRKVTEANKDAVELTKEEIEPAAPRTTEADKKKDFHSLDRQGERNLYLIIKKKAGDKTYWLFPEGSVQKSEFLHDVCTVCRSLQRLTRVSRLQNAF
jgi:large subunit ribosomal protein L46